MSAATCCFTSCQVVANTGGVLGLGMTPHEILPRPGRTIVDVDGVPFKGPKTPHTKWHKVLLDLHFVLGHNWRAHLKPCRTIGCHCHCFCIDVLVVQSHLSPFTR
jgi:hypothetical protein